MPSLKVAVIVDNGRVQQFGLKALDTLKGADEITVFSCRNTRAIRKPIRHGAYYVLNFLSVRNQHTNMLPVTETQKKIAQLVEFDSGFEGAWQTLPAHVIEKLAGSGFDLVVKLGMGLLRVPSPDVLPVPILAWHHGDPGTYRGRPAGFWEMAHEAPVMGQIIQILSNKLDGGAVVAFAETKIHRHSYRATLIEAYQHSHLLLNEAVRNTLASATLQKSSGGKNYRLPSNLRVARFAARMVTAFVKRLFYGALIEKKWQVSTATLPGADPAAIIVGDGFPPTDCWQTLPTPREYQFLADPFFSDDPPGIVVEALSRRSSVGEIALMTQEGHRRLSHGARHFSYPFTLNAEGGQLVFPEMAKWGEQRCFRIGEGRLEDVGAVEVEGGPRMLDPTVLEHEGRFYLFANDADQGSTSLMLWSAERVRGPYQLHPFSPIRIAPSGGRMAGAILRTGERLVRFGQSFLGDYGDGIFAFEIERLTAQEYRERPIGCIRFEGRKGPHTINFDGERVLFDWYQSRFSALAGFRRAIARLR